MQEETGVFLWDCLSRTVEGSFLPTLLSLSKLQPSFFKAVQEISKTGWERKYNKVYP